MDHALLDAVGSSEREAVSAVGEVDSCSKGPSRARIVLGVDAASPPPVWLKRIQPQAAKLLSTGSWHSDAARIQAPTASDVM